MVQRILFLFFILFSFFQLPAKAQGQGKPLDIVLVVDISASTSSLITSVKAKFWELNNEISRIEPQPDYRLGLLLLGRPSFLEENAYVYFASDLTKDIDYVAHELFDHEPTDFPGKVLYGNAIREAVKNMSWSEEENALKMMFVVGNGPLSNGYSYQKAVEDAVEENIIINALYFPTYTNYRDEAEWKDLAERGKGEFSRINLKEPNIVFEKNYHSDLLLEVNDLINKTYVPYGPQGEEHKKKQVVVDYETDKISDMAVESRAFFKATNLYQGQNAHWDLVDKARQEQVNYSRIKRRFLDESMQGFSDAELQIFIEEKIAERKEYVSIINMLSEKREEYLKKKKEKLEKYRFSNTFFGVFNKMLKDKVNAHGFQMQ